MRAGSRLGSQSQSECTFKDKGGGGSTVASKSRKSRSRLSKHDEPHIGLTSGFSVSAGNLPVVKGLSKEQFKQQHGKAKKAARPKA